MRIFVGQQETDGHEARRLLREFGGVGQDGFRIQVSVQPVEFGLADQAKPTNERLTLSQLVHSKGGPDHLRWTIESMLRDVVDGLSRSTQVEEVAS